MRGSVPPLPNTPPWRGAQLNKGTTLLLPCQIYFVLRTILLKGLTEYLRAILILIDYDETWYAKFALYEYFYS
jgi:hypothetical protein